MAEQKIRFGKPERCFDFKLDLNPDFPADAYLLGHIIQNICYEPEIAWTLYRILKEGDWAVDVGANVGFFTVLMAKLVGPTGLVYAFEPGDNNLPRLSRNLSLNALDNVRVIDKPAWARCEQVTFYTSQDDSGGNALWDPGLWPYNEKSRASPNPVRVEATTLSQVVRSDKVRVVKIDVEGAEHRVLEGASGLLSVYHPPYIIAELNPFGMSQMGTTELGLRKYMGGHGYSTFLLDRDGKLPALVPPRTVIEPPHIINILFSTISDVGQAWQGALT